MINKNIGSLPVWQFAIVMVIILIILGAINKWFGNRKTKTA